MMSGADVGKGTLAVHVSFKASIMQDALENWPDSHKIYQGESKSGLYYYNDDVYKTKYL